MLIFGDDGSKAGQVIIGLGLAAEDLSNLAAGIPIKRSLKGLGIEGEVFLIAGTTEEALQQEIQAVFTAEARQRKKGLN